MSSLTTYPTPCFICEQPVVAAPVHSCFPNIHGECLAAAIDGWRSLVAQGMAPTAVLGRTYTREEWDKPIGDAGVHRVHLTDAQREQIRRRDAERSSPYDVPFTRDDFLRVLALLGNGGQLSAVAAHLYGVLRLQWQWPLPESMEADPDALDPAVRR